MKEHLMSINKYTTPKIAEDNDAIHILIIRLLLLVPGTIQSNPKMGVGVISNWRYKDMSTVLGSLQNEILTQIRTYLPTVRVSDVMVERHPNNSTDIIIKVMISEVVYAYETNNNTIIISDFKN